ncbi:MAG: hypothetical protein GF320_07235, partial [Armatimonadia bacterium]|nr:hypothetical protein [Armatimonadia bacterium]
PKRPFGSTGEDVSLLTFGGGSQFLANPDGVWEPMLERALEAGVTLFDTAPNYVSAESTLTSQERFGKILPPHRDRILISSKFEARDAQGALRQLDESLAALKTDHLDVWFFHAVTDQDDLDAFEAGPYKEMARLKDEGVIRFMGFSSMDSAEKSRQILERLDMDVALLALNATRHGAFVEHALPAAAERGVAVMAMKVVRDLVGPDASPKELLHYAWGLDGVSTALIGHAGMDVFEQNLELAATYRDGEMDEARASDLERRMARYRGPHALCWARPDYVDGDPGYRIT